MQILNRTSLIFCRHIQPIVAIVPRVEFHRMVKKHDAERNAKGIYVLGQFVSMLFCQLAGAVAEGDHQRAEEL